MSATRPPEARFWAMVNGPWCDERLDGYDACWSWLGATVRSRPPKRWRSRKPWRVYGRFHFSLEVGLVSAHRACLLLYAGPPPDDDPRSTKYVAAHRCDNSVCVHPGHLLWQTQQQNIADAVARGRLKRVDSGTGVRWASTGAA